jgi:hypothetical protein
MKQLHFKDTFKPLHPKDLSVLRNGTVLESHLFLKETIYDMIKGGKVAGVNKRKGLHSKDDDSSPTGSTHMN